MNENSAINKNVIIDGKRVRLRMLSVEEVTIEYVNWMNDSEVNRYTESRYIANTLESVRQFVDSNNNHPNILMLGIFDRENELHIGNIKLGPINWKHSIGDVGIIIGRKSYWGKGIASEVISLMCQHAFNVLKLWKITAGCYAENKGSVQAFLNVGFVQEGLRLEQFQLMDRRVNGVELGYLNPDRNRIWLNC